VDPCRPRADVWQSNASYAELGIKDIMPSFELCRVYWEH
jgi:hypothetical protein